ncbi:conserved pro-fuselloviral protein [Acidianus hospitalis W1]|uniref:Conserved pro-fuselloviral protein n=1 Tax=Acidianus hospitalis (strain W1) TaxID=933801 RepID=F4B8Y4_ACIHW|nr:hypothetical protein [Acidianus hospitalis]AEE95007.1 conserved pro-fuselloviral protein [Acidianus hospitalis W1]
MRKSISLLGLGILVLFLLEIAAPPILVKSQSCYDWAISAYCDFTAWCVQLSVANFSWYPINYTSGIYSIYEMLNLPVKADGYICSNGQTFDFNEILIQTALRYWGEYKLVTDIWFFNTETEQYTSIIGLKCINSEYHGKCNYNIWASFSSYGINVWFDVKGNLYNFPLLPLCKGCNQISNYKIRITSMDNETTPITFNGEKFDPSVSIEVHSACRCIFAEKDPYFFIVFMLYVNGSAICVLQPHKICQLTSASSESESANCDAEIGLYQPPNGVAYGSIEYCKLICHYCLRVCEYVMGMKKGICSVFGFLPNYLTCHSPESCGYTKHNNNIASRTSYF